MERTAFYLLGMPVRWYGLIIGIGLVLAVVLACYNAKHRKFKQDDPFEWLLWVFVPGILGARLYFCIFYDTSMLTSLRFFEIWNGGIAIYGGIIGGAIGAMLYCIFRKKNFLSVADVVMPSLILAQGIGRWGNFTNQEAYGNLIIDPNLQWFPFGVNIPNSSMTDSAKQQCIDTFGAVPTDAWFNATFFYESLCDLIICVILFFLLRKCKINGIILSAYMILYGIIRFFIEGIRTDSLMTASGLRVSQIISLAIVLGGAILAIILIIKNKKKQNDILQINKENVA